jgi:hypothetical protein
VVTFTVQDEWVFMDKNGFLTVERFPRYLWKEHYGENLMNWITGIQLEEGEDVECLGPL